MAERNAVGDNIHQQRNVRPHPSPFSHPHASNQTPFQRHPPFPSPQYQQQQQLQQQQMQQQQMQQQHPLASFQQNTSQYYQRGYPQSMHQQQQQQQQQQQRLPPHTSEKQNQQQFHQQLQQQQQQQQQHQQPRPQLSQQPPAGQQMNYPYRAGYQQMNARAGPVYPGYYQDRRYPQNQMVPGPMSQQNYAYMQQLMNQGQNPALYGQPANPYVQSSYTGPNVYTPAAAQQSSAPRRQVPIKREKKILAIVNPVTMEKVTSSKSSSSSLPAPPEDTSVTKPESKKETQQEVVAEGKHPLAAYLENGSSALKIEKPPETKPESKALKIEKPPSDTGPAISQETKTSLSKPQETADGADAPREPSTDCATKQDLQANSVEKVDEAVSIPKQISEDSNLRKDTGASTINAPPTSPQQNSPVPEIALKGTDSQEPQACDVLAKKEDENESTSKESAEQIAPTSTSVENSTEETSTSKAEDTKTDIAGTGKEAEGKSLQRDSLPDVPAKAEIAKASTEPSKKLGTPAENKESFSAPKSTVEEPTGAAKEASSTESNPSVSPSEREGDGESWRKAAESRQKEDAESSWRDKSSPVAAGQDSSDVDHVEKPRQSTPKRQRPRMIVHEEGARCVYDLSWLHEMREFCSDTKPPTEAVIAGIAKGSQHQQRISINDGRGSHGGKQRGGVGGGGSWERGNAVAPPPIFPGGGGGGRKGGIQYPQSDRGPRRGVKLPPMAPVPSQNWRGSSRGTEARRINKAPPLPPVKPLEKSENAWKPKKEDDDEISAKRKAVRSILNKLTPEKFERLYKQLTDVQITSLEVLDGVVKEIFEKALLEQKFADMYAELCHRLDRDSARMLAEADLKNEPGKPSAFKRMLLSNVQQEFTRFAKAEKAEADAASKNKEAGGKQTLSEEEMEAATNAKRRRLGNINFIGELYKQSLLPESVIHKNCVRELLNTGIMTKEESVLEALCKLLTSVGQKLSENTAAQTYMNRYFKELESLSMDRSIPSRIRFMMQNLIEMRQNNWKQRRVEAKAKKISEVHADIEREEREKQEASRQRNRGRSGGRDGGGRYGRFDRPMARATPAMTMAPARAANGPLVSRAKKSRDRFNVPTNLQSRPQFGSGDVRLGATGGQRPFGTEQSSAMSLKPGGSGRFSNAFSALSGADDARSATSTSSRLDKDGSRPKQTGLSRPPMPPKKEEKPTLSPQKEKDKARSILQEYLSISDLKEARECVQAEVPKANHAGVLSAALNFALEQKPENGERVIPVFAIWRDLIDLAVYRKCLGEIVENLDDIEMDAPVAGVFLSKCIGRLALQKKLVDTAGSATMGLDFLKEPMSKIFDGKSAMKLVIRIFAELMKGFEAEVPGKAEREAKAYGIFRALDIDLKELADNWNPARGRSALKDLLAEYDSLYLEPLLGIEEKVNGIFTKDMQPGEAGEGLKGSVSESVLRHSQFVRLVVKQGFDFACDTTKQATKDTIDSQQVEEETTRLQQYVIPFLVTVFGSAEEDGFAEARFQMVLGAQQFAFEHKFPPGIMDKEKGERKLFARLLLALYEGKVVEIDVLRRWKEDLQESDKVGGKAEALVQCQRLFAWLESTNTEES